MARINLLGALSICLLVCVSSFEGDAAETPADDQERKTYIVYMGALPNQQKFSPLSQHITILEDVLESSSSQESLVRSFGRSFNGFTAKLTEKEREKLAGEEGVVSVFPSTKLKLHTTKSWDFLGFPETAKRVPSVESDLIIGVIDTGVWPESESFTDEGFGPVPERWKGSCKGGRNFTCNKKIIGARVYSSAISSNTSARDMDGHGSHTASTAAGNVVKNVNFYGLGKGNARGGVPSARIAVYKACTDGVCEDSDVLAAFDDAIADGVDIISVSLGPSGTLDLDSEVIAIGSFHAMAKGVLTSCSAGNDGPDRESVVNVAPWTINVAATTTDRRFTTKIPLGNGDTLDGSSINTFALNGTTHAIVYGKRASTCAKQYAEICYPGCLNGDLIKGKIVACKVDGYPYDAVQLGAIGTINLNDYAGRYSYVFPAPWAQLTQPDFAKLESYLYSTTKPKGSLLKTELANDTIVPIVAFFSARGPNRIVPDILKPDIAAPGVNILAAFSPLTSSFGFPEETRRVNYAFLEGTSMSCPHVTAVAAYVKSFHPTWSPAAIKSAIMTTARSLDLSNNQDAELAYGSGLVDPVKARDPGLVYDATKADYINMLCNMGYGTSRVRLITGDGTTCPTKPTGSLRDLNYPSMAANVNESTPFEVRFPRKVTNVGPSNSTYTAQIKVRSRLIKVQVEPSILSFKSPNETKSFEVTVTGAGLRADKQDFAAATLVWSDGHHHVKSPILVYVFTKKV